MILVDTSVWIDYFRTPGHSLAGLLARQQVLMHPWVLGELALGNLRQREETLGLLASLSRVTAATDDELLTVINATRLYGQGIGYVDVALLASCRLAPGTQLWTSDKRLKSAAETMGLAHTSEADRRP